MIVGFPNMVCFGSYVEIYIFCWKPPPRGDSSNPISGTNTISTGTKIVPVGPWDPRKIFLSSKMMNSQPQHIQKREIVDLKIIKYKYKS